MNIFICLSGIFLLIFLFIYINPTILETKSIKNFPKNLMYKIRDRDSFKDVVYFLNNYKLYSVPLAVILSLLILSLYLSFIDSLIKAVSPFQDIFIISLTFILVYATLSLLSFTHSMALVNEEKIELLKLDIENDREISYKINEEVIKSVEELNKELTTLKQLNTPNSKKISEIQKKIKDTEKKTRINWAVGTSQNIYKRKLHQQLNLRKAGQMFFMATILSSISFFLLYGFFILSKASLPADSFFIAFKNIIIINANLFHFFTLLLLMLGFLSFLRGLYKSFIIVMLDVGY